MISDQGKIIMEQSQINEELQNTKFGQDMVILGLKKDLDKKMDELVDLKKNKASQKMRYDSISSFDLSLT